MKKSLLFVALLLASTCVWAQSAANKAWSIDYHTWNTTGQPRLYINCGNDEHFNTGEEITMEVWARAYTFAENRKIMGKMMQDEPFNDGYVLGFENLHVYAEYFNPGLQTVPRPGDGPMEPDSSLVHIASTYSSVTGQIKSYVNGVLVGETTMFPANPIEANTNPFIIGNAPWDMLSYQFYGEMDEVRVWNKALSQDELQSRMHVELMGNEEGLVAYYNFNEAHDSIVPDRGPYNLGGVLANAMHQSTEWAVSHAPVAGAAMATMQNVQAAWYRPQENYYKIINDYGLSLICDIPEKAFEKYVVMGNDARSGITANDAPVTNPTDFKRSMRTWYINTTGDTKANLVFDLDNGQMTEIPTGSDVKQYAVLYRSAPDKAFAAIAHASAQYANNFVFNDVQLADGYYALGYASSAFDLQEVGLEENIFKSLCIAPNPVQDYLRIDNAPMHSRLQIYALDGRQLLVKDHLLPKEQIDMSEYPAGVYLLQLQSQGQVFSQKIIVSD